MPAVLSLYLIAPFGDRCSGLAHIIGWILLAGLFTVVLLVEMGVDLYKRVKLKQRFDFVPLIIAFFFATATSLIFKLETWKPWTEEVFRGQVEVGDLRSAGLTLYANGTFNAYSAFVDYSCNYSGDYSLNGDTLSLFREDLPSVTNNVFSTRYLLRLPDSSFTSLENGFEPILKPRSIR
ncbi:MAG TPA: hypothetical protein PL070_00990 [Flavobacteriales bacterium]|nr:hypothetical protein [Flavobacteriales bacterium]